MARVVSCFRFSFLPPGRLSVGLISDSGMISRPTILATSSAMFGLVLNILPMVSRFWSICFCSSMAGLSVGTIIVVLAVLVGDYAGKVSDVPVMLGLISFLTGVTGLGRPSMIGKGSLSVQLSTIHAIHAFRSLPASISSRQASSETISGITMDFSTCWVASR